MAKKKPIILNFPITLLQGFLKPYGVDECVFNIFCYGAYAYGNASAEDDYSALMGGATYLGITEEMEGVGVSSCCSIGSEMHETHKGNPMTGVSVDTLLDLYYNGRTYKEDDKVRFLMFAAFKSFFADGKKAISTTNNYLFARMDGKQNKVKHFTELPEPLQVYYNSRRKRTRLINDLQLDWGLRYYSFRMEGFWVSFDLTNKQLISLAEARRKKNRLKELNEEIKEARNVFFNGNGF